MQTKPKTKETTCRKCAIATTDEWIKAGEVSHMTGIPVNKIGPRIMNTSGTDGGQRLFRRSDVEAWVAAKPEEQNRLNKQWHSEYLAHLDHKYAEGEST